jgi:ferredoxin
MDPATFLTELKRRKVYRVAVAYAIVAWLLIQAASILFPTFEAPPWVMKVFVTAVILGFPVALILAWAFELTPEGISARKKLRRENRRRQAWEQMDRDHCRRRRARGCAACVSICANTKIGDCRAAKTNRANRGDMDKSVAVLPFENLSSDKENAFFAQGIQDEIITTLSRISGLRVISRTSTARYSSAPENLPEIARNCA